MQFPVYGIPGMTRLAAFEQKIDPLSACCPVRAAVDVIRGRWKPGLLFELQEGPRRFGELQTALRGITAQALTVQLRQLEADGVVERRVYAEVPARVEYTLSPLGRRLSDVMEQLDAWGRDYQRRK